MGGCTRALAAAVLGTLMGSGCSGSDGGPKTSVLVTLLADETSEWPEHALVTWSGPEGVIAADRRIPPVGIFPPSGPLGTIHLEIDSTVAGERTLSARGLSGNEVVSTGSVRVMPLRGRQIRAEVVLRGDPPDGGTPDAPPAPPPPLPEAGVEPAPERPLPPPEAPVDLPPAEAGPEAGPDLPPDSIPVDGPPPLDLETGLVGYWKLDEGMGTTTTDSSRRGHTGMLRELSATDWTTGRNGRALSFGLGWIRTSVTSALNTITNQITLAAWMYRNANQTSSRIILQRQMSATVMAEHYALGLLDNKLFMVGLPINTTTAPDVLPLGRWVHVAGTYDGATIRLYVDGSEVLSAGRRGTFPSDTTPLTIGAGLNTADPDFEEQHVQARLDDVLLYNRALTPEQIRGLAAGQQPR